MRTWLTAAVVALGLALGYAVGFAMSVLVTTSQLPFLTNPYGTKDDFTRVFRGINRLAAAEEVAGSCGARTNNPLAVEDFAIHAIQDRASAIGLNPPLDVARARLALRRAMLAEKDGNQQLRAQYEESASQLLQKSGWQDPSAAHLRQILARLDAEGSTCSTSGQNEVRQK